MPHFSQRFRASRLGAHAHGIPRIPDELNSSQVRVRVPQYQPVRIPSLQGLQQVNINLTSSITQDIVIPADPVYNLDESILEVTMLIPEDLSGNFYTWMRVDGPMFLSQIVLSAVAGGAQMMQLPFAPYYMKMMMPRFLKQQDVWTRDYTQTCFQMGTNLVDAAYLNGSAGLTLANLIQAAGAAGAGFAAAVAALAPGTVSAPCLKANGQEYGGMNSGVASATSALAAAAGVGQYALTPASHFNPASVLQVARSVIRSGSVGSANIYLTYQLKLGDIFPRTFLAMNKDFWCGEQLKLSITFGNMFLHAWSGTSPSNPATGPAQNRPAALMNTFSNIILYLATETDAQLADQVRNEMRARGMIAFPYVQNMLFNRTQSPFSISQNVDAAWGSHLVEVMWSPFNPVQGANTGLDNSNIAPGTVAENGAVTTNTYEASKITNYTTMIGAGQLQQMPVQCDSGAATAVQRQIVPGLNDDWLLNKRFYRDSIIGTIFDFRENWAHIDEFGSANPINPLDWNQVTGIPLGNSMAYTVFANYNTVLTTGGLNIYMFAIVWKRLVGIGRGLLNVM